MQRALYSSPLAKCKRKSRSLPKRKSKSLPKRASRRVRRSPRRFRASDVLSYDFNYSSNIQTFRFGEMTDAMKTDDYTYKLPITAAAMEYALKKVYVSKSLDPFRVTSSALFAAYCIDRLQIRTEAPPYVNSGSPKLTFELNNIIQHYVVRPTTFGNPGGSNPANQQPSRLSIVILSPLPPLTKDGPLRDLEGKDDAISLFDLLQMIDVKDYE